MRITKVVTLFGVALVAGACSGLSPTAPSASMPGEETASVATKAVELVPAPLPCSNITDVAMQVIPNGSAVLVFVQATYLQKGQPVKCGVSPTWDSKPAGRLIPTKNPFVVRVSRTNDRLPVNVTAQAPNRVLGSIDVK